MALQPLLSLFSVTILWSSEEKKQPDLLQTGIFWESCGESNITCINKSDGHVDPLLKLWFDCETMLTRNEDVKNAKANGTRCLVKQLQLKPGEQVFMVSMDGIKVPAVFASQVKCIVLEHLNKNASPQQFTMTPQKYSVKAHFPVPGDETAPNRNQTVVPMSMVQLPVTSNTATTGHKLQGTGVDNLLVSEWRKDPNWIYVILSRVTALDGLFLRKELDVLPSVFAVPEFLKAKIDHFQRHAACVPLTENDYESMCMDS